MNITNTTKNVYGYIRVSTLKQGNGVSLEVQKADISRFAESRGYGIIGWFEEKKSASKGFRPEFNRMIGQLYNREADGFIAHKIDRMMRNRHDWAVINELIDGGCEVLSADGTTLDDVNGRFMGDIQAAVATRYSSNLAEEAKKGLYGRLKQGYYPFLAPLGYTDNGGGELKTIDPVKAPLVKQLFDLYTKQGYTVRKLVDEMYARGLRNTRGNRLPKNSIIKILKNPFYTGIMEVKGQQFKGNHEPIITMQTYRKAQEVMAGKTNTKVRKHNFLYRKMLNCACGYKLIGELQKGNVYYRCQTRGCPTKSLREGTVDLFIGNMLKSISMGNGEVQALETMLLELKGDWLAKQKELFHSINLRLGSLDAKLERITELLINGTLDTETYESEKRKILAQRQELNEQQNLVSSGKMQFLNKMQHFLELAKHPNILYDTANTDEKRELLGIITSNLQVEGKRLMISMVSPFHRLVNRDVLPFGGENNTTTLNKASTIVYSDTRTSPIIPKPMDDQKCREFFNYLLGSI